MKSLYEEVGGVFGDKIGLYTDDANELDGRVGVFLRELINEFQGRGYNPIEIRIVIQDQLSDLVHAAILKHNRPKHQMKFGENRDEE